MQYYGKLSGDGKAVAFYVDTINDIPVGATALSEPQWRELVAGGGDPLGNDAGPGNSGDDARTGSS